MYYLIIANTVAFVISTLTVIVIFIKQKNNNISDSVYLSDKTYKIIFLIGAVVALFVRIYKFSQIPGGINQDGAMAAVDAKALLEYGTDRFGMEYPVHLTGWGYGQMSALLSYLMVPFIKLFGLNSFAIRLPSLLISMLGIFALYFLAKSSSGKNIALVIFLFAAINPWHIMQSRWALDCNLYPHFFILGIFLLNKGLNNKIYLYMSMIVFGLSMYCYGISIYTMTLFLAVSAVYLYVSKNLKLHHIIISALVYLLVAWPFLATMIINTFKFPTLKFGIFTIPYFPESVRKNDILFFSTDIFKQIISNCISTYKCLILQNDGLLWNGINGFGIIYLFSLPFFVFGIYKIFKHKMTQKPAVVLMMIMLVISLVSCIITNNVNINRLNIIVYPLIYFTAIGIYYVISEKFFVRYITVISYIAFFIYFSINYFTVFPQEIDNLFFKDFQEAVVSISDEKSKIYITSNVQRKNTASVSEILTLFFIDADAKYYQGDKRIEGMTFNEKYSFDNVEDMPISSKEDAIYIVRDTEADLFNKNEFTFEKFGRFYVIESIDKNIN